MRIGEYHSNFIILKAKQKCIHVKYVDNHGVSNYSVILDSKDHIKRRLE